MRPITELNELKQIELDIMKDVHAFCVNNSITYYLAYGTLIGAMRHNGFIPWDDDIDIYMPRGDYERFCRLFSQSDNPNLELVNSRTKHKYRRAFSKVIDKRTVVEEDSFIGDDPIGVFVDIWPLDGMPENEEQRSRFMKKKNHQRVLLYGSIRKFKYAKSLSTKIFTLLGRCINTDRIIASIEADSTRYTYEESSYVMGYDDWTFFQKNWFGKPILHQFEDTDFYVPENSDAILTAIYGEWRVFPPAEQQKPHHIMNIYWK